MPNLRIATYNIEWMNNLFVKGEAKLRTKPGKGMGRFPSDPAKVADRIAGVIKGLDAHIIGVQEGPASLNQIQFFCDEFLDSRYKASGFESGSQSIYALVRDDCPVKATRYDASSVYYTPTHEKAEKISCLETGFGFDFQYDSCWLSLT